MVLFVKSVWMVLFVKKVKIVRIVKIVEMARAFQKNRRLEEKKIST